MCTDFSNMPKDWVVCFMHDCILKEQCLRYYAAKTLSISQHSALTVLPSARSGNSCKEFHTMKKERLAWGFSHLFDDVKHSDYRSLRGTMESHFGSRFVYYRYHRGINKLSEGEQQWVDVMAMLPHVFMITTRRAGNNSSAFGKELRSERE